MRVAIITTSYPLYEGQAAGHFVAAEAEVLCRQGHDVTVIAPGAETAVRGATPRLAHVSGAGLFGPPGALSRLRSNPLRARGALAFAWGARRLLASLGPFDRVIAHWLIPCAWPVAVGCEAELEAVAHGSDVKLLCALPRPLRLHIARALERRNVSLRCVSENLRDALLLATSPALAGRMRVEPSPIVIPETRDRLRLRAELGLRVGSRLALVVSRLIAGKRISTSLEAISYLPGVDVVVIGGGPLLPLLRAQFPHVRFTGELTRPRTLDWIAAADVLVSASRLEGAPTVVREARALGVPVVAYPAGDLERWAQTDQGLWLF